MSLGPAPGTEATPWYLKGGKEEEEDRDKKEKGKNKSRTITEEEREKKDRKLKDSLDPLKEMKKALAVKDRKEKKHKKEEKKDRGEKRGGERCEIHFLFLSTPMNPLVWLHNNVVILNPNLLNSSVYAFRISVFLLSDIFLISCLKNLKEFPVFFCCVIMQSIITNKYKSVT